MNTIKCKRSKYRNTDSYVFAETLLQLVLFQNSTQSIQPFRHNNEPDRQTGGRTDIVEPTRVARQKKQTESMPGRQWCFRLLVLRSRRVLMMYLRWHMKLTSSVITCWLATGQVRGVRTRSPLPHSDPQLFGDWRTASSRISTRNSNVLCSSGLCDTVLDQILTQFPTYWNWAIYKKAATAVYNAAVNVQMQSVQTFAASLKPGPHQQQCRSNVRLCCQKRQQCRCEFCVEILSFRQSRTLLWHCCPKQQHCRSNSQQSCLLLRQCCLDIVASVDRA